MLLFLLSPFASAQSTAVVARAVGVTGQATLTTPGAPALALTPGYILSPGDRIDTRGGGRVVIDLSDGSIVVVSPESLVTLKDFRAATTLREFFEITLGVVRVKINHFGGKPNPYRMNSPTASIAVRGTEFTIEVDSQGATQVTVIEGAVEVSSISDPARSILLQSGQTFRLVAGLIPLPANAPPDRDRRGDPPPPPNNNLAQAHGPEGHPDGPPGPGGPQSPGAAQPPQPPQPGKAAVPPTWIANAKTPPRAPTLPPTTGTSRVLPTSARSPSCCASMPSPRRTSIASRIPPTRPPFAVPRGACFSSPPSAARRPCVKIRLPSDPPPAFPATTVSRPRSLSLRPPAASRLAAALASPA